MNYFPSLLNFKNTNQISLPYFFQYGYQCPFFLSNPSSLSEMQYNPQVWMNNNELIQNIKQHISQEQAKLNRRTALESQKESDANITEQIKVRILLFKNNSDKDKREKKAFKQKEGRNMISNIFRQALKCMLTQKQKTIELIEKIAQKQQIQINPREFLDNISKKLKNLKNYVRIGQIEIFLKGKENGKSKQHAKVLRIMVNRFLREQVIPCLCNNPKVQNNNRLIHILERRKFNDLISLC